MKKIQMTLPIHPAALAAFETKAEILSFDGVGTVEVIRQEGQMFVIAGFLALSTEWTEDDVRVRDGLSDADIERIAWREVAAILRIMTTPTDVRSRFGAQFAKAPLSVLEGLGMPPGIHGGKIIRLRPSNARNIDKLGGMTAFKRAQAALVCKESHD